MIGSVFFRMIEYYGMEGNELHACVWNMLKWICILIVIGLLLYFFRFRMAAICVWAVSGIVFAVLLVLLAIESHQDKVLNEIAIEENKKNGKI